ncbi:ABC transporter ATP-binding protein [Motilimonas sp. 1_MG-2023]|uniref:ABC transporter ATP-binding protein n=1 Tax=Motilimonas sp. 1_MG-2023 TaxID=3062672 RepID=UPI0026E182DF|nr:ABC transporter ATP-binding protein [Motilimonas sp. 1_MG-2023]MDO6525713.1 ABC transporter ATP-binding protein [Motilimonas sp. 1_MG-2023]
MTWLNAIEIKNLIKIYKGGNTALKGISLTVKQGDFYALLGPNGAGKSTTIGILSSLVNKTSGEVKIFGDDIDTHLEDAKRHIGLVPQEFNFNQFEAVEQILVNQAGYYGLPRKEAWQRAEICLKQLDLWDKRKQQSRTLSGGMKRRLMIARALMHQPKLLILDEPTAGVDIELRRSMWVFLQQLNKEGITIVLTTHYLEEAETLCRNIGIINQGELIENTSMKSLLARIAKETFVLDTSTLPDQLQLGEEFTRIDEHTLEVEVLKDEGLNATFSKLTEQGVQVLSMRNKSNRLEELFVELVQQGSH